VIPDPIRLPTGTPYPADPSARRPIARRCAQQLFTPEMPPGYRIDAYLGSPATWANDPEATCVAVRIDGSLTSTNALP
jgi:hypothetical protein